MGFNDKTWHLTDKILWIAIAYPLSFFVVKLTGYAPIIPVSIDLICSLGDAFLRFVRNLTDNMITRLAQTFIGIILSLMLLGCDEPEDLIGNWLEVSDFEGVPRSNAIVFVIGDFAYVGTGFDGDDYLSDIWRYDARNNFWTQQASLPGLARTDAVAFATNGRGYVGTGFDGDFELKDFWEFDPVANSWRQIADFGGSARRDAVAFSLNDRGYVGTGNDENDLKDFWEYNPMTDTWRQIVSLGGSKRVGAFAMVVNNRAFVGGGRNNGIFEEDFWEFDPLQGELGTWIRREDLDTEDYDVTREDAVALGINGFGYLMTGSTGGARTDVWEYDLFTDTWDEKTSFDGVARTEAVGFVIGNVGYVTTGRSGAGRFDDLWAFFPDEPDDEDD